LFVRLIPGFTIAYKPDFRQAIADTWPRSIDDSDSYKDWGLKYDITIDQLAKKILAGVAPEYKKGVKLNM
jgi:hypothetical protein